MTIWLLLSWLVPLFLVPVAMSANLLSGHTQSLSPAFRWLSVVPALAAAPALIATLLLPANSTLAVSWLLLGSEFGLSPLDQQFLLAASLIYLAAGIYLISPSVPEGRSPGFIALFLTAMAGNILLICAMDPASFYLGFTLMSLSAYGLVIHKRGRKQLFAGKVYLVMTLIGEVALFSAIVMFYLRQNLSADVPAQGVAEQLLFLFGFGIKGGLLGLHMWLPLAHPAAPVPASAVLSGVMIKAALIGMLRYLPIGEQSIVVGEGLLFLSLTGALLAAAVATIQRDAKVVLAYSSVAKMGSAMGLIAVMLIEPVTVPLIMPLLGFFALYHGICKSALFLGVGWFKQHASQIHFHFQKAGLLLIALTAWILIGAPFGAGAVLKAGLSDGLAQLAGAGELPAFSLVLDAAPLMLFLSVLLTGRLLWLLCYHARSVDPVISASESAASEKELQQGATKFGATIQLASFVILVSIAISLSVFQSGMVQPKIYDLISLAAAVLIISSVLLSGSRVGTGWSERIPPGDLIILIWHAGVVLGNLAVSAKQGIETSGRQLRRAFRIKAAEVQNSDLKSYCRKANASLSSHVIWVMVFVALVLTITFPVIQGLLERPLPF